MRIDSGNLFQAILRRKRGDLEKCAPSHEILIIFALIQEGVVSPVGELPRRQKCLCSGAKENKDYNNNNHFLVIHVSPKQDVENYNDYVDDTVSLN